MRKFYGVLFILFMACMLTTGCAKEEDNYIPLLMNSSSGSGEDVDQDNPPIIPENTTAWMLTSASLTVYDEIWVPDEQQSKVSEPSGEWVWTPVPFGTIDMEPSFDADGIRMVGTINLEENDTVYNILYDCLDIDDPEYWMINPLPAGEMLIGYDGKLKEFVLDISAFSDASSKALSKDGGPPPQPSTVKLTFTYDEMDNINAVYIRFYAEEETEPVFSPTYALINEYNLDGQLIAQTALVTEGWHNNTLYYAEFEYGENSKKATFWTEGPNYVYDYTYSKGKLETRIISIYVEPDTKAPVPPEPVLEPYAKTQNFYDPAGKRTATVAYLADYDYPAPLSKVIEPELVWEPEYRASFSYNGSGKLARILLQSVNDYDEDYNITETTDRGFVDLTWEEMTMPTAAAELFNAFDILTTVDWAYDYFGAGLPFLLPMGGPY